MRPIAAPAPSPARGGVSFAFASTGNGGRRTFAVRVELRDHDVGRVRDDGAANTGNVAAEEGDAGLLDGRVALLGLAELLVDGGDGALKGRKLDHCVGDLAAPERDQAVVEAAEAIFGNRLAPAFAQRVGVWRERRLHAHLDGLEGAEEDVGDELGGRGCAQVDEGRVGIGEGALAVEVLEDFVEAVLARALKGVADKGGRPAEDCAGGLVFVTRLRSEEDRTNATHALLGGNGAPCLHIALVDVGVDLTSAFDQVEGRDCCVGGAAS